MDSTNHKDLQRIKESQQVNMEDLDDRQDDKNQTIYLLHTLGHVPNLWQRLLDEQVVKSISNLMRLAQT